MLIINFKGNTPQSRFNYIGVKGDNASNKVGFLVQKVQEEIDLSQFNAYLKVQSKEHEYIDKILLTETSDTDFVYLTWEITRKSTHYRNLELQIVFEGTNEDIVWQTMMFEAELSDTIKVDETLPEEDLSVLEQYGKIVMSFEARLEALEQNALRKSDIVDDLESSDSEKVLSAKQGKVLNDKINIAISGTYKPRGSKTVAQLNAIDTSTLENGFVFNVLDSGILTIGSVSVREGDNVAWIIENNVGSWDKLAGMVDLSDYPTKSGDETITGSWTFNEFLNIKSPTNNNNYKIDARDYDFVFYRNSEFLFAWYYTLGLVVNRPLSPNGAFDLGTSTSKWKDLYLSGKAYVATIDPNGNNTFAYNTNYTAWQFNSHVIPLTDNLRDLGASDKQWKDLYLAGKIDFGNNTVVSKDAYNGFDVKINNNTKFLVREGTTYVNNDFVPLSNNRSIGARNSVFKDGYFSGQVYAQNTFNVINASDITSNTLTQEQYDLITNGKPTLIKGAILSTYTDCLLFAGYVAGSYYYASMFSHSGYPYLIENTFAVNTSTKVISIATGNSRRLDNVAVINGKTLPAYPSNTGTFGMKSVDGTLTWCQEWYGTQAQYDALGTYDSNTIYNIIEE